MPPRENPADRGRERGRRASELIRREFRDSRLDRGVTQGEVGRAVRLSPSEVSRVERGLVSLDLETASAMLAVVGLDLSVRVYPAGQPLRAQGHGALLERLHVRLHASLEWRTEVSVPIPGDLRAWDAVIRGRSRHGVWIRPVEAETAPRDFQALERRLELKMRDSDVDAMVLLLADTRHNREFIRVNRASLASRFPVPGERALELLRAGAPPDESALIVL